MNIRVSAADTLGMRGHGWPYVSEPRGKEDSLSVIGMCLHITVCVYSVSRNKPHTDE